MQEMGIKKFNINLVINYKINQKNSYYTVVILLKINTKFNTP